MTHTIHRAVNHRDPLTYPRLENDETFSGRVTQNKVSFEQRDLQRAQNTEPWKRLYSTGTLASARQEIYSYDPKAPVDSLDFILKSQYDQHNDTFATKARTRLQLETISENHGYFETDLKNRIVYKAPVQNELNHPLRIAESSRREHINEPEQAILGIHSMLTNRGYARNHLGSYFLA